MLFDTLDNFAYTNVVTAPTPATSGNTITVTAGTGVLFTTPQFNAVVWPSGVQPLSTNAEVVRVTLISTDSFVILRAREGSTARAIVVGDQFAQNITKKMLTDLQNNRALAYFMA